MKYQSKKGKVFSRRSILPILGSSLLIPFLGFSNLLKKTPTITDNDEEYKTLLKADGTSVKVKVSTLKNSKIVKKNISNSSLLKWLSK